MTCDVQELLDEAECFFQLNPELLEVVFTQLLCEWSGGSCDVQTLLDEANCFYTLNERNLDVVTTQLLCDLSHATI